MSNNTFTANRSARLRFGGELVTVISCNGCVAVIRDSHGDEYPVPVGEICRA